MGTGLRWAAALVAACSLAALGEDARAQSAAASAAAAANPEYQALFKRMYANPRDVEATFRFAEVAERLGDYEAAIGALERVLMFNPNLPQVKLRLGTLYQRIGGVELARAYYNQAMNTPGASPEVVAAAQQLMQGGPIAGGGGPFSLYVWTGVRHQSNASAGPANTLIRSFGDVVTLDSRFGKAPDWNAFTLLNAGYTYDISNGVAAEFSLFGYYGKQFELNQFDLGVVELTAGPRFALPWSGASLKVYGIGTASWLADDPYFTSGGAGASLRFTPGGVFLEPFYEFRDREFRNSEDYPISSEQSGQLHLAGLVASGNAFGLPYYARVAGSWNRTDESAFEFNSYDRFTADIGFPIPFTLSWFFPGQQFVFTPTAGYGRSDYALPNPAIDADIAREDRDWRVGAALDMQIHQEWGLRTFIQYAETSSNLPNFEFNNLSISVGPTYRF